MSYSNKRSSVTALLLTHTAHYDPVFRVASWHYAHNLALLGAEVTAASTPRTPLTLLRALRSESARSKLRASRRSTADAGVQVLTETSLLPLLSPVTRRGPRCPMIRQWLISANQAPPGIQVVVVVDAPQFGRLVEEIPQGIPVIYRVTDNYAAAWGPRIRGLEERICQRANFVVFSSAALAGIPAFRKLATPSIVIENGVEFEHFNRGYTSARDGRIVYWGATDGRLDMTSFSEVAEKLPKSKFEIIGPRPPVEGHWPPNVNLVGPVPYRALPSFLQGASTLFMPLTLSAHNAGRSPMKFYEAWALGMPVVTLGQQIDRNGDMSHGLLHAQSVAQAVDSLYRAERVDREALTIAAARQDWKRKTVELARFAGLDLDRSR